MPKALEIEGHRKDLNLDNYKILYPVGVCTEYYENYKILKSLFDKEYIVCRFYTKSFSDPKSFEIRFLNEECLNLYLLMITANNSVERIN